MSTGHHGSIDADQRDMLERFSDQVNNIAARAWPQGRMSNDDDGELTYGVATDVRHQCIKIVFPKPVEWIGLGPEEAEVLRDKLTTAMLELRGITP